MKRQANQGWGREIRGEVGWRELYLSTRLWFLWNNVNISNGTILSNREQKLERNIKSYNSKVRRMWLPLSNHSLISHLYFSSSGAILPALKVEGFYFLCLRKTVEPLSTGFPKRQMIHAVLYSRQWFKFDDTWGFSNSGHQWPSLVEFVLMELRFFQGECCLIPQTLLLILYTAPKKIHHTELTPSPVSA